MRGVSHAFSPLLCSASEAGTSGSAFWPSPAGFGGTSVVIVIGCGPSGVGEVIRVGRASIAVCVSSDGTSLFAGKGMLTIRAALTCAIITHHVIVVDDYHSLEDLPLVLVLWVNLPSHAQPQVDLTFGASRLSGDVDHG